MDNIFQICSGGNELSVLMNTIPSRTDIGDFNFGNDIIHERLISTKVIPLTSIEAIYIPNDDI